MNTEPQLDETKNKNYMAEVGGRALIVSLPRTTPSLRSATSYGSFYQSLNDIQ